MGEIVVRLIQEADLPQVVPGVIGLYQEAGWVNNTEPVDQEQMAQLLRNSFRVMGAFAEGRIIGMMRALSDGVSDAYLLDMVVSGNYRRQVIASRILQSLVEELKKCQIEWIVCIAVPGKDGLYAKLGTPMQSHVPYRFL